MLASSILGVAGILLGITLIVVSRTIRRLRSEVRDLAIMSRAVQTLKKDCQALVKGVEANHLAVTRLLEAWNRSIFICETCQRLMFLTDAVTVREGGRVTAYCVECHKKLKSERPTGG